MIEIWMPILDEDNLLTEQELKNFLRILSIHNKLPEHFLLEILEDQQSMDMNDLNYVVIISTRATHLANEKTKTYSSPANSGTWLAEFEQDMQSGYFL